MDPITIFIIIGVFMAMGAKKTNKTDSDNSETITAEQKKALEEQAKALLAAKEKAAAELKRKNELQDAAIANAKLKGFYEVLIASTGQGTVKFLGIQPSETIPLTIKIGDTIILHTDKLNADGSDNEWPNGKKVKITFFNPARNFFITDLPYNSEIPQYYKQQGTWFVEIGSSVAAQTADAAKINNVTSSVVVSQSAAVNVNNNFSANSSIKIEQTKTIDLVAMNPWGFTGYRLKFPTLAEADLHVGDTIRVTDNEQIKYPHYEQGKILYFDETAGAVVLDVPYPEYRRKATNKYYSTTTATWQRVI